MPEFQAYLQGQNRRNQALARFVRPVIHKTNRGIGQGAPRQQIRNRGVISAAPGPRIPNQGARP